VAEQGGGVLGWVRDNRAQLPKWGAEMTSVFREAIKDVRSKVMSVFLNSPELGGEMGAPLNPTPQTVTKELGTVYGNYNQVLDGFASRGGGADQFEKGKER
jgi:hypothetical protein